MMLLHEPESRSISARSQANVIDEPESTEDYEDQLLTLLCRLECLRQGMDESCANGPAAKALDLANQFAELVAAFSEQHCAFAVGKDMDEATSRLHEFRSSLPQLVDRLGNTNEPIQPLAAKCFTALHDATFAYFTVFTSHFPNSRSAHPWVEAAAGFLVELKHLTREPIRAR